MNAQHVITLAESQPDATRPKLRWYQYSLRTLLIFITLCALPCSWLAVKMQQARQQRDAVDALRHAGMLVYYDYQLAPDGRFDPNRHWPGPAWLFEILGEDMLATAVRVDTEPKETLSFGGLSAGYNSGIDETHLTILARLVHLKYLSLRGVAVMDSRLQHLAGLLELEYLSLSHHEISDDGLAHLGGLPRLNTIYIAEGRVTKVGLAHLAQFKSLKEVTVWASSLDAPAIDDRALDELRAVLPGCKVNFSMFGRGH